MKTGIGFESVHQQLVLDATTDRENERKKALAKSPKIRHKDLIPIPTIPRTLIQFKKGSDKAKAMSKFLNNYGKI